MLEMCVCVERRADRQGAYPSVEEYKAELTNAMCTLTVAAPTEPNIVRDSEAQMDATAGAALMGMKAEDNLSMLSTPHQRASDMTASLFFEHRRNASGSVTSDAGPRTSCTRCDRPSTQSSYFCTDLESETFARRPAERLEQGLRQAELLESGLLTG